MSKKLSVLVVDDQVSITKYLSSLLGMSGYSVDTANKRDEAIKKLAHGTFDLVIVDLKLGEDDGIDVLKSAREQYYNPEVILITGYGSIESAVEVIKLGAFDYVTKPFESKRMLLTVQQAMERKKLKHEVALLRLEVNKTFTPDCIVGQSPEMRKLMQTVEMIAKIDSTVLIEGESGTGKELIAKAIHSKSERRGKPFIPVNCGALPEALLESELFGYVKGAYTGAVHDKKGLFEEAEEGTILLDEIGDMPMPLQVKLLRVLQSGEIRKLGDSRVKILSLRVIALTNKKLESLVKAGTFREDLFYRLNVIPITVPPLRERREDIAALLIHYLEIFKQKFNRDIKGFEPEAVEFLINYDWPGNVRELANLIERTAALAISSMISLSDISRFLKLGKQTCSEQSDTGELELSSACERTEKEYILKSLVKNEWNQTLTAKNLGISRTSLWRKMKTLGIQGDY